VTVGVIHLGLGPVPEESPDVGVALDVRLASEIEVPAARLGLDPEGILQVPVRLAAPVEVGHRPLLPTLVSGSEKILVDPQSRATPTKSP